VEIVFLCLLAGVVSAGLAAAAEPESQDALIQAHLAAGEFAPALTLARQAAEPRRRDAWLAQIASAQAQAGARDASYRSAAEISDDLLRKAALEGIATQPWGGRGGGAEADFDSLIDLITSTIQPTTWDTVGGPGSVAPFATGVAVDAQGLLRPLLKQDLTGRLAEMRAAGAVHSHPEHVRRSSPLRMISLPRLERHVQLRLAAGQQPTEDMHVLAGLQRVKYLFVYPAAGDIVLAGPAGDWCADRENRILSTESGQPVVRLDDLVVVLRHVMSEPDARFGCLINPTQEGLTRLQASLEESKKNPLHPSQRKTWLEGLRWRLGKQDIEVYGLDPRTRAARVMVEADYRMKLVGMGLEEGVPGVKSYLELVEVPPGQAPPPLGVLRWWFTLNYQAVLAAEDRQAFQLRGQGVQVLSENERLTAEGKRIHTGESEQWNRQFARSFTEHFAALCEKYPIYAELRNLFDLALLGALIRAEGLADKAGWHLTCFGDPAAYQVELGPAPKQVDTVVNHRVIHQVHVLAGVSGGVACHAAPLAARSAIQIDSSRAVANRRAAAGPSKDLPLEAWWWDSGSAGR
jgi:hypothetical protein